MLSIFAVQGFKPWIIAPFLSESLIISVVINVLKIKILLINNFNLHSFKAGESLKKSQEKKAIKLKAIQETSDASSSNCLNPSTAAF